MPSTPPLPTAPSTFRTNAPLAAGREVCAMTTLETTPPKHPLALAIRSERSTDVAARARLLDVCFGADRESRTCQRLREGRLPADGLAFTATHRRCLVG